VNVPARWASALAAPTPIAPCSPYRVGYTIAAQRVVPLSGNRFSRTCSLWPKLFPAASTFAPAMVDSLRGETWQVEWRPRNRVSVHSRPRAE
jgi:hypothetical protein